MATSCARATEPTHLGMDARRHERWRIDRRACRAPAAAGLAHRGLVLGVLVSDAHSDDACLMASGAGPYRRRLGRTGDA